MMIEKNLGKKVSLMVVKKVDFGVYLGTSEDKVSAEEAGAGGN